MLEGNHIKTLSTTVLDKFKNIAIIRLMLWKKLRNRDIGRARNKILRYLRAKIMGKMGGIGTWREKLMSCIGCC